MIGKSILLVDDDSDILQAIGARCRRLGCDVHTAHNLLTAMSHVAQHAPDLICVDVMMPTGNGLRFCEALREDAVTAAVPLVVLTGHSDPQIAVTCRRLDAHFVTKQPNVWNHLEPLFQELLQQSTTGVQTDTQSASVDVELCDQVFALLGCCPDLFDRETETDSRSPDDPSGPEDRPWILCVDDDVDFSEAIRCRLESQGVSVVRAYDGMAGYRLAFTHPAEAILLDYHLPNGDGQYILQRLKDNPVTRDIPVIVLTGEKNSQLKRTLLAMGASAFLNKPVEFADLWQTVKACAAGIDRTTDSPEAVPGTAGDTPCCASPAVK